MAQSEQINIIIREDGVPVVQNNLNRAADAADRAGKSVDSFQKSLKNLQRAITALASVFALRELAQYADAWTAAQNRIRVFTASAEEARAVHYALFKVIQDSRQEMAPMVSLYSRVAQAAGNLGASQQQLIDFTEGIAKALSIQGVTTENARGALLQLGQAMGMAKLRAQEFNSINEQAPIILQTVAKQLYGASGSTAQLRDQMLAGTLTAKTFYDAFMTALPNIRKQFELVTPTIGQAFTVFRNSIMQYIGRLNEATGAAGIFAKGVIAIANNLDLLSKTFIAVLPLLVLWVGTYLVQALAAARAAMLALTASMLANPITAMITVITTLIATMYAFGDSITVGADGVVTLRDYVVGAFNEMREVISTFVDWTVGALQGLGDTLGGIDILGGLSTALDSVGNLIKGTINTWIGVWVGLFNVITTGWKAAMDSVKNLMGSMYNSVLDIIDKLVQGILNQLNSLFKAINAASSAVGLGDILNDQMKSGIQNAKIEVQEGGADLGSIASKAFGDAFSKDYVGAFADGLTNAAKSASVNRLMDDIISQHNANNVDLNAPGAYTPYTPTGKDTGKKAQKELEKLTKQYQQLVKMLEPTTGAQQDYQKGVETLTNALSKGLLTGERYNELLAKLKDHYLDAMDPLSAMQKEQAKENIKYAVAIKDQEAYAIAAQKVLQLKKAGVTVTEDVADSLMKEAQQQIRLESIMSKATALYQQSPDYQMQGQADQLVATVTAMQQGAISANQFSVSLGQIAIAMGQIKAQSDEISTSAFFNGAMAGVMQGYEGIIPGLQTAFSDFFASLSDGIANSIGQAIVYGDSLRDSLANVAQQITSSLIAALIKLGIQYAVNAALAATIGTATATASSALAGTTAAAWAPAAALVSLASFGGNSAPAMTGMAAAYGLASSMALGSMAGFESGGYTGNGGTSSVAGVVHGQEYVFNADATNRLGVGNLERLSATGDVSGLMNKSDASYVSPAASPVTSSPNLNVTLENHGSNKDFEVQQLSETDIRIIARDVAKNVVRTDAPGVVGADMRNPNGRVSKGLATNTTTKRKR